MSKEVTFALIFFKYNKKHLMQGSMLIRYSPLKEADAIKLLKFSPGAYFMYLLKRCWALIQIFTVSHQ